MSVTAGKMQTWDSLTWVCVPGLLYPGDLLLEVNGNPVVGMEPEKVIQILVGKLRVRSTTK